MRRWTGSLLLSSLLAATAGAAGAGCTVTEEKDEAHNLAPDLVLERVDGSGRVVLADQKGKVVLVDLWATWCVPCIAELPHLQALSERFAPDELLMLGIVLESGEREDVLDFLADKGITYTQVMGEEDTGEAFGPFLGYPTKYLIDQKGRVVKRYFGIVGEELTEDVETLIRTGKLAEAAD